MIRFRVRAEPADEKVLSTRRQVSIAVTKMSAVLDKVQTQAEQAKEELSARGAG